MKKKICGYAKKRRRWQPQIGKKEKKSAKKKQMYPTDLIENGLLKEEEKKKGELSERLLNQENSHWGEDIVQEFKKKKTRTPKIISGMGHKNGSWGLLKGLQTKWPKNSG